ncbi:hypothetical protein [Acinetobacter sp. P1(2025)]|uniref:hypothetical protein n=1 Tax=Acinetobacter sp. P1(2025) TaxID=3446120 RepID=UPI003F537904
MYLSLFSSVIWIAYYFPFIYDVFWVATFYVAVLLAAKIFAFLRGFTKNAEKEKEYNSLPYSVRNPRTNVSFAEQYRNGEREAITLFTIVDNYVQFKKRLTNAKVSFAFWAVNNEICRTYGKVALWILYTFICLKEIYFNTKSKITF